MKEPIIGIDLGTTNSVVAFTDEGGVTTAIAGDDGNRVVPSVVHFQTGGDPVVGALAKQNAVVEPERVAQMFKRGMGSRTFRDDGSEFVVDGKTWLPEELSALVLKKLKQMAETHFGEEVRKAVITVPAYFGFDERKATETAGELAGLEVVRLVNEPTAAAIAHQVGSDSTGKVLVFDLGGGTFDVTIMDVDAAGQITVLATGGDHRLGGADFDALIVAKIAEAVRESTGVDILDDPYSLQEAKTRAEDLKKDLSQKDSSTKVIPAGGKPVKFTLTEAEFRSMIADYMVEIEDHIANTIRDAGITAAQIDTALLVGGSSRIPAFQEKLAQILGKEPRKSKNLDEDVARGAAMLAVKTVDETQRPADRILDASTQLAKMPKPKDVTSRGLGTSLLRLPDKQSLYNHVMIPANSPIPAVAEEEFYTVEKNQTALEVTLNEGESDDLDYVDEKARTVGEFGRAVAENYPIRAVMEYTESQLIKLRFYDGKKQTLLCELEVESSSGISPEEKDAARQALRALAVE